MDTCEVVLAKIKGSSDPVRVNKQEFDLDQDKPTGERQYTAYTGKDEPEQADVGSAVKSFDELGVAPQAAPSAPDFSAGPNIAPLPRDEFKDAIAPAGVKPNDLLVMKDGTKWYIVNGTGDKQDETGYKTEALARDAIKHLGR